MTHPAASELTCTEGKTGGDHFSSGIEQIYVVLFGKPREQARASQITQISAPATPVVASHSTAVDYTIS